MTSSNNNKQANDGNNVICIKAARARLRLPQNVIVLSAWKDKKKI